MALAARTMTIDEIDNGVGDKDKDNNGDDYEDVDL